METQTHFQAHKRSLWSNIADDVVALLRAGRMRQSQALEGPFCCFLHHSGSQSAIDKFVQEVGEQDVQNLPVACNPQDTKWRFWLVESVVSYSSNLALRAHQQPRRSRRTSPASSILLVFCRTNMDHVSFVGITHEFVSSIYFRVL